MDTEKDILNFINSYFSDNELRIIKQMPINRGNNNTITNYNDYNKVSEFFFKIFNLNPDHWDLQTDESGSDIIDKLIKEFCKNGTMFCKTRESYGDVIYNLNNSDNVFLYVLQNVYNNSDYIGKNYSQWVKNIIDNFYQSKSKKLFILLPRMIPGFGYILPKDFFILLKKELNAHNIEHIIILDDCQAGFYIQDQIDYELFDGFFTTAHLYFPGLSGALLFIKNKKIAYKDLKFLQELKPKMEILYKNRYKAIQFNNLLTNYFSDVNSDNMSLCNNDIFPKHQFIIHCNNVKPIPKYCRNLFSNYMIRMFEADIPTKWIRIRFEEALIQDPHKFLDGLKLCKKYMQLLDRQKSFSIVDSFDNNFEKMYDTSLYQNIVTLYKRFYNQQQLNNIILNRIKSTLVQYQTQLINIRER